MLEHISGAYPRVEHLASPANIGLG